MDLRYPELPPRYATNPKTGQEPDWDAAYTSAVNAWCDAAYEEAEYDRKGSQELKQIGKFIDYIEGRHWKGQGVSPTYKAKPTYEKVRENFEELVGQLTDIKPMIEVRCTNTDKAYQQAGPVINKSLRAWSLNSDFDLTLAQNIAWAILTTSYTKWQYNPDLANGQGDLEAIPLGPNDVWELKPKNKLQEALAVIKLEQQSMGWFRRNFPTRYQEVTPDARISSYMIEPGAPAHIPSMLWSNMSDGMKRTIGAKPELKVSAFPHAMHQEFWFHDWSTNSSNTEVTMGKGNWSYKVKPFGLLYPRGRIITRGGRKILSDNPNPYWHSQYPFSKLRLNVLPWSQFGNSDVRPWVGLNDILNQILAGAIQMIKRATNPGMFAPRTALSEEAWQSFDWSKPGERVAYSMSAGGKPEFAPAPMLPGYVITIYQFIERALDQMSGKAAGNAMLSKKQIPGADTIENIQMMRTTPLRMKGRNIETFLRDGGRLMVPNIVQWYSDDRRKAILGSQSGTTGADSDADPGTIVPAGTPPEEFIKSFDFFVQPGSLLQTDRVKKVQDALVLKKFGLISAAAIYRIIDDPSLDYDRIKKEIKQEAAENPAPPPKAKGASHK